MKRIFTLLMAAVTSLSLAACSAKEKETSSAPNVTTSAQSETISENANDPEESSSESSAEISVTESEPPVISPTEEHSEDAAAPQITQESTVSEDAPAIDENGSYSDRDDVALYIHTYGHLPGNFITKKQARELGWEGGSVEEYAPGKCIGGDRFGNYEGLLPEKDGRRYTECDIDTLGKSSRGAKRIIFSNDGLIYYTEDHYASFTLLYGEE